MAVYRFRIAFEDHDDVYREIDILGKQTYEEFHRAIQEAISFDNSKDASFFMSDDYWRKGQEVALNPPKQEDDDDDDYPSARNKKKEIHKASKSKVADYIDDPHQKMIYVFDPKEKWTVMIELIKILSDEPKVNYPRTSKSVGAAPKQYKQVIVPPVVDEDEEDDEEDKKSKEKIFMVVEAVDETDHVGDAEEGEEPGGAETEEGESSEESEEEGGDDFDPESFGGGDAEDF